MYLLGIFDYITILIYFSGIIIAGIYFSKKQNTLSEFFHASGNIPWWAVSISNFSTGVSPISYLAAAGWIFVKDSRLSIVPSLIGLLFVPLTVFIWLPLWSRLRVFSIYEYLEIRFQPWVRSLGAVLYLITTVIWVGTGLTTVALGFEQVTGIDARWFIFLISVAGTTYTVLGGMRAVIWTDVIQFGVFLIGYAAIIFCLLSVFEWKPLEIYRIASETISLETGYPHTKLISFELDLSIEATLWVLLFSKFFFALSNGTTQWEVQRLHSTGSRTNMLKAIVWGKVIVLGFSLLWVPIAWGFVAFYVEFPEAKTAILHPDQVLPDFVARQLPGMFRSLVFAGILAALMSTLDSGINSMGSVTTNDFIRRFYYANKRVTETKLVVISKVMTIFFSIIIVVFCLWQMETQHETAFEKMGKLSAVFLPPITSFFLLGVISKRTNTNGAVIGGIAGVSFAILFNGIPGLIEPTIHGVNWMWVASLATAINVGIGYVASFVFPPPLEEVFNKIYQS